MCKKSCYEIMQELKQLKVEIDQQISDTKSYLDNCKDVQRVTNAFVQKLKETAYA